MKHLRAQHSQTKTMNIKKLTKDQASEQIDDGGPAFPCIQEDNIGGIYETGMSLRDWFAGMVLQGLAAASASPSGTSFHDLPSLAYQAADEMIKARKKKL